MTDLSDTATAFVPPAPRRLLWRAMRLAWHGRALWHRIVRPLTMGVRAIVLDGPEDAPRVLLIRHSYIGGWHLPGGGVDRGETIDAAMRREVREEVGLSVDGPAPLLGLYARFAGGVSDHVGVFVVKGWSGTPTVDGVEIVEARFFPLDALPPGTTAATRRRIAELTDEDRATIAGAQHW